MKFSDKLRQSEAARSQGPIKAFAGEAAESVERGELSNLLALALEVFHGSGPEGVLDRGHLLRIHDRLADVLKDAGETLEKAGRVPDPMLDDVGEIYRTLVALRHPELQEALALAEIPQQLLGTIGRWAAALNASATGDGLLRLNLLLELHDEFYGPQDVSRLREQAEEAEKAQQCRKNALLDAGRLPSEDWARVLLVLFRAHRKLKRELKQPAAMTAFLEYLARASGQPGPLIKNLILHWAATVPVVEKLLEFDGGMRVFAPLVPKPVVALGSPYGLTHYLMIAGPPKAGKSSLTFSLEDGGLVDVFPISPGHAAPDQLNPLGFGKKDGKTDEKEVNDERERWSSDEGETVIPVVMARGRGGGAADGTALNLFIEDVPGGLYTKPDQSSSWKHWIANRKPTAVALLVPEVGDFDSELFGRYRRVVRDILEQDEDLPVFLLVNRFDQQIASYPSDDADPELLAVVEGLGARPLELGIVAGDRLAVADPKAVAGSLAVLDLVSRQLGVLNQAFPSVAKHPVSLHFTCCRHDSPVLRKSSTGAFWEQAFGRVDRATRDSRATWMETFLLQPIENNYATGAEAYTDKIAAACSRCNRALKALVEDGWEEGENAIASGNEGIRLVNELDDRLEKKAARLCSEAAEALKALRRSLDELLDQLFALAGIPPQLSRSDFPNREQQTFIDNAIATAGANVAKVEGKGTVYHYRFGTLGTGIPTVDDRGEARSVWQSYDELRSGLIGGQKAEAFFARRLGVQALTDPTGPGSWLGLEPLKTDVPWFIASSGTDRGTVARIFGRVCEPFVALYQNIAENLDAVDSSRGAVQRRLAEGVADAWQAGGQTEFKTMSERLDALELLPRWKRDDRRKATLAAMKSLASAIGEIADRRSVIEDAEGRGYLRAVLKSAKQLRRTVDSDLGEEPELDYPLACEAGETILEDVPRRLAQLRQEHLDWLKRFLEASGWLDAGIANLPLLPPDPNVVPDRRPVDVAFIATARQIVDRLRSGDD